MSGASSAPSRPPRARRGHARRRPCWRCSAPRATRAFAFLARDPAPAAAAPTLPTADMLTSRISNCVGIWETNRGGDAPNADRVLARHRRGGQGEHGHGRAGDDALRARRAAQRNASLRKLASPELTMKEIDDAIARSPRSRRCSTRSRPPPTRAPAPTTSSRPSRARSRRAGSPTPTCARCSAASSSRRRSTRSTATSAARTRRPPSRPPGRSRRPTGSGSAPARSASYITDPKKWGENRAAWQRLAVDNMPGDVGTRINSVATSSGGTALAGPVIRARVDAELAKDAAAHRGGAGQDRRGQEQPERDELRRQHLGHVQAPLPLARA